MNNELSILNPEALQIYKSANQKYIYVCLQYVSPLEFYRVFPNAFPITEDEMKSILDNHATNGVTIIEVTADGKTPEQRQALKKQ